MSPAFAGGFFTAEPSGKPLTTMQHHFIIMLQVASKSLRLAHIQDERSENPPLDGRSVIQFADIHSDRFDSSRNQQ